MSEIEAVVAGHVCLDLTPRFGAGGPAAPGDVVTPGGLVQVGECVVSTGGCVANTGAALSKLGVRCALMGRAGDDAFGRLVVEILGRLAPAEGIVRVPGASTSYTVVIALPGFDRAFLHHPGANDAFGPEDVDFGVVARARLFHLGYPTLLRRLYEDGGKGLADILSRAKECGATTSVDVTMPDPDSPAGRVDWDALLRRALPHVDVFMPNIEEALFCLERDRFLALRRQARARGLGLPDLLTPADYEAAGGRLLSYGPAVVALKAGARGLYLRTADAARLARLGRAKVRDVRDWAGRELWQAAHVVEHVVNATGAGDCATAGLLTALLRGHGVGQALRMAAAAGARSVTADDAVSGLGSYEETVGMARDYRPAALDLGGHRVGARLDEPAVPHTAALDLGRNGWRPLSEPGLWAGPADGTGTA